MSQPRFGKRQSASATGMERRGFDRRRTAAIGKIHLGPRKCVNCSIVDVSSTGALLTVANAHQIPDTFKLEDDAGRRRTVRVTRRGKTGLGVSFA